MKTATAYHPRSLEGCGYTSQPKAKAAKKGLDNRTDIR
jgi:hypothetical protein